MHGSYILLTAARRTTHLTLAEDESHQGLETYLTPVLIARFHHFPEPNCPCGVAALFVIWRSGRNAQLGRHNDLSLGFGDTRKDVARIPLLICQSVVGFHTDGTA
jgi:hypothetical protein